MSKLNCSKCGALKTGSYIKESWCGVCRNERRRQFKIEIRQAKGLPTWGSGRDPKCKDCGELKEESYKNGNYCRKCKCAREKERYERNKEYLGKESRRIGRNPICKCGIEKENLNEAYCSKCSHEKKRLLYQSRKNDPKFIEERRAKSIKRLNDNFQNRLKKNCREATHRRIKSGLLIKGNCEVCKSSENIQAHHPDYTDPMNVRWLCYLHHAKHHQNELKSQL